MIGRSHGIHAEPITAGLVFARWNAEVVRASSRLVRARHAIAVGKVAGAVGVYGNLDPSIERAALGELGLEPETVATQIVARDRHAEVLSRDRAARHRDRADRARRPALAAHRGRRGRRRLRRGPERLVGDAAQEEPDPEREPDRARAAVARLRASRHRRRRAVARARHLALERRARRAARRDDPRRLHARARDGLVQGLVVHAARMRANLDRIRRPVLLARPCCSRSSRPACRASRRTRWCSASALAAINEAAAEGLAGAKPGRFRELLGKDPDITRAARRQGARRVLRSRSPPAARARDPRPRAGSESMSSESPRATLTARIE